MAVMALCVTPAGGAEAGELAAVAAATFPLACPASAAAEDIAEFVRTHLSAGRFAEYLTDPDRIVFVAQDGGRIVGYAMLIRGIGADPDVARAVPQRPAVELSKMYVLPSHHRSGAAAALLQSGIDWSVAGGATAVWLGVNKHNIRAQRFYRRHGFEVTGSRTFRLGAGTEADFVMVHRL
ncbi:MAG: GNAT family N-acetyltransferase [Mycobacterium sp.]|nr:GNAT family N-acetyltransferase [Mycobacterium sp.]